MRFSVIWLQSALDRLARVYTPLWGSAEGRAITEAMAEIDRLLETDAGTRGESRAGRLRLMFVPPLSVLFEVHDEPRVVIVTDVRYRTPR